MLIIDAARWARRHPPMPWDTDRPEEQRWAYDEVIELHEPYRCDRLHIDRIERTWFKVMADFEGSVAIQAKKGGLETVQCKVTGAGLFPNGDPRNITLVNCESDWDQHEECVWKHDSLVLENAYIGMDLRGGRACLWNCQGRRLNYGLYPTDRQHVPGPSEVWVMASDFLFFEGPTDGRQTNSKPEGELTRIQALSHPGAAGWDAIAGKVGIDADHPGELQVIGCHLYGDMHKGIKTTRGRITVRDSVVAGIVYGNEGPRQEHLAERTTFGSHMCHGLYNEGSQAPHLVTSYKDRVVLRDCQLQGRPQARNSFLYEQTPEAEIFLEGGALLPPVQLLAY